MHSSFLEADFVIATLGVGLLEVVVTCLGLTGLRVTGRCGAATFSTLLLTGACGLVFFGSVIAAIAGIEAFVSFLLPPTTRFTFLTALRRASSTLLTGKKDFVTDRYKAVLPVCFVACFNSASL